MAPKKKPTNKGRSGNSKAPADVIKDKAPADVIKDKAPIDPNKDKAGAIKAAKDKAAELLRQLDLIVASGLLSANETADLQNDLNRLSNSVGKITKKTLGRPGSNGELKDIKTLYLESVNERLKDKLIEVLLAQ